MKPLFRILVLSALATRALAAPPGPPPWETEPPLREAAKSAVITGVLAVKDPQPNRDSYPRGRAFQISNPAIRSTLWGPADRITFSLLKNDIWDRRVSPARFTSPTLAEIVEGANAPINRNASDLEPDADSTRPQWGYLRKEGGKFNPYQDGPRYPFPTAKPTGQFILGIDALNGAPPPELAQDCADGVVRLRVEKGGNTLELESILSMTSNIYALRGRWAGPDAEAWLRLYRHRDTAHERYMAPDGRTFKDSPQKAGYEADKAWNGPLDPPTSGSDGRYFWIRQTMPAEKTFPKGFEYVLMGRVGGAAAKITTAENQAGLGTPVPDKAIREATGAAATASLPLRSGEKFTAYAVVVTTIDAAGGDVMAAARQQLDEAAREGFDGLVVGNARWYAALYDRRENGRIFVGDAKGTASDDIDGIFHSWYCLHDGATRTDMRKFQASAHYVVPEKDVGAYGSLPCYNEVFYTPEAVRNRSDSTLMWKELVEHWMPAAEQNAREVYGLPGMFLTHGFLPPIKADKYVHSNVALELSVDTQAQVLKTLWDEWDYGGDPEVLAEIYPAMREMAIFYAAYAKRGVDGDGVYHIVPSMQEESWGIQPGFSHSRDTIAAISMFRWALTRAAEAAKELGRDADLAKNWLEITNHLPPYPTWKKPEGVIFAGMPGVEPWRGKGEHPWDIGTYPTVLADDINLDSDAETRETMLRTARVLRAGLSGRTAVLLGVDPPAGRKPATPIALYQEEPERLLNSRSGRIHLFPALPAKAGRVAFHNFQARGGFLVSACRDDSGVTFLEVTARRKTTCRVMNPWPGRAVTVTCEERTTPITVDSANGECLVFDAEAGRTYALAPAS